MGTEHARNQTCLSLVRSNSSAASPGSAVSSVGTVHSLPAAAAAAAAVLVFASGAALLLTLLLLASLVLFVLSLEAAWAGVALVASDEPTGPASGTLPVPTKARQVNLQVAAWSLQSSVPR